jgi:hypothetical protein
LRRGHVGDHADLQGFARGRIGRDAVLGQFSLPSVFALRDDAAIQKLL